MIRTLLAYEQRGGGPERVLVLPGVPNDFAFYGSILHCLDGAAFTYAFPDYRGFGRSRAIEGDYSLPVDDARRLSWLPDAGHPPDLMRRTLLSWLPNAALEVIPNCGHFPMQESPVFLATTMEAFMQRHTS